MRDEGGRGMSEREGVREKGEGLGKEREREGSWRERVSKGESEGRCRGVSEGERAGEEGEG